MEHRIHPGKTGMFEDQKVRQENEILLSKSPFDVTALKQQSYSTDAQAVKTTVARNPATQYLVINSKDRNQTSSTNYIPQPWNKFKLQRPQNIMQTYATRMLVSEINFPYYIPNINPLTQDFWIAAPSTDPLNPVYLYRGRVLQGFQDGTAIAESFNVCVGSGVLLQQIYPAAPTPTPILNPPRVSYDDGIFTFFKFVGASPSSYTLYFYNPLLNGFPSSLVPPSEATYYTQPSLLLLMGMDYNQVNGLNPAVIGNFGFTSNPTTCQYTQYIDIVSDKLHQYSTNRDGNSDTFFSRNLLCRLYISDETSNIVQGSNVNNTTIPGGASTITEFTTFIPGVSGPFIIHRQFKNPKAVMWNKEATVDWLDISVYDEYGNLIPLPFVSQFSPLPAAYPSYPDFNITLLASES